LIDENKNAIESGLHKTEEDEVILYDDEMMQDEIQKGDSISAKASSSSEGSFKGDKGGKDNS
jgi:hypothetical protein